MLSLPNELKSSGRRGNQTRFPEYRCAIRVYKEEVHEAGETTEGNTGVFPSIYENQGAYAGFAGLLSGEPELSKLRPFIHRSSDD